MIRRRPSTKAPINGQRETTGVCACGCGQPVVRNFKPGHDQRLVGDLIMGLIEGQLTDYHTDLLGLPRGWGSRTSFAARVNRVVTLVTKQFSPGLAAKVGKGALSRGPR
jgi:hypothetical protein